MKSELQNKLVEKYPSFFKYLENYEGPIIPIQFGFECGDGWYWLLDRLMDCIDGYCNANKKDIPQVTQIKEKYGTLRFYYNGGNEMIDGMVWLAEDMSCGICEDCGATETAMLRSHNGWLTTRCNSCYEKKYPKANAAEDAKIENV